MPNSTHSQTNINVEAEQLAVTTPSAATQKKSLQMQSSCDSDHSKNSMIVQTPQTAASTPTSAIQNQIQNQIPLPHQQQRRRPYVIGVCGASCSGKTTLCDVIRKELCHNNRVAFLPSDSFYKDLTESQRAMAYKSKYDFDHPNSIAWEELLECLRKLTDTEDPVTLPQYDFKTHSRVKNDNHSNNKNGGPGPTSNLKPSDGTSGGNSIGPADIIIVEGILIYAAGKYAKRLRNEMDLRIYVDCDSDMCLARRIRRDVRERGRDAEGVLKQYMKFVKPSQLNFVEPGKRFADVIIPNHTDADEKIGSNQGMRMGGCEDLNDSSEENNEEEKDSCNSGESDSEEEDEEVGDGVYSDSNRNEKSSNNTMNTNTPINNDNALINNRLTVNNTATTSVTDTHNDLSNSRSNSHSCCNSLTSSNSLSQQGPLHSEEERRENLVRQQRKKGAGSNLRSSNATHMVIHHIKHQLRQREEDRLRCMSSAC